MQSDARIEDLLDATRDVLLAGRLDQIGDLAEALSTLSPPPGLSPEALSHLGDKARRNERLLSAAAMGLRAARRRAAEIAQHGNFSTYDAKGRRDPISQAPGAPPRRL